jgi:hypothetical protein
MHVLNISSVFGIILQVLYMDVSKVDRVLHLSSRFLLPRFGVSSSSSAALHSSQTAEGAQRGPVKGVCQGPVDGTRRGIAAQT